MCKVITRLSLLLLAGTAFSQTVNPNQIRPSANSGDVLTTVVGGQPPQWAPGGGGSGPCGPLSGDSTSTNCGNGNLFGTGTHSQIFGLTNGLTGNTQNGIILNGVGNMTPSGVTFYRFVQSGTDCCEWLE